MPMPQHSQPLAQPTREINVEQFERKFRPKLSADGARFLAKNCRKIDRMMEKLHDLTKAYAEAHTWTVVENDDSRAIVSGRQFVNRLWYVVTEHPHNGADIVVPLT